VNVREVLNRIFYVLWTGCQWKALPKDLPPKSTGARLFRADHGPGLRSPVMRWPTPLN
jgi:transposase